MPHRGVSDRRLGFGRTALGVDAGASDQAGAQDAEHVLRLRGAMAGNGSQRSETAQVESREEGFAARQVIFSIPWASRQSIRPPVRQSKPSRHFPAMGSTRL